MPALEEEIRYLRLLLDEERNVATELRTQLMEREQSEGHLRQSLAEAYETLAATARQVSGISPLVGQAAPGSMVATSGCLTPPGCSSLQVQSVPVESESTDAAPDHSEATAATAPVPLVGAAAENGSPVSRDDVAAAQQPIRRENDFSGLASRLRLPTGALAAGNSASPVGNSWFAGGEAVGHGLNVSKSWLASVGDPQDPPAAEPDIEAAARVASHIVGSSWEKAFQKLWRKWSEERAGKSA